MATCDTRIHCVLYFIAPSGRGLKPLDVAVMRELANRANLVPVIGKADSLTKEERKKMKKRVLEDLAVAGIGYYQPPEVAEVSQQSPPYAVCGANVLVEVGGELVRARQYPWGMVEVENPDHSDFGCLRAVLTNHVGHLKEVTNSIYESIRIKSLHPFQRTAAAMEKSRRSSASNNYNNNFVL